MIQSFKCKYTKQLFNGKYQKKFSQVVNNIGKRKLDMLDAAFALEDLKVSPSNHLEQLQGDLKGFYSIRINNQFRLIFKFENSNAYDVYIDDYHK
ncbi:type II toxin-antitoxin system RelE/ParE family toxin [Sulfurimonas sediminis]|uniref:Type II toxin-antitoxin system RelE/ParE family toxin n=1 Tax=Sulfurimonas sediminis TaxID=2590020 RepID=A0A7M1B2I8_9BACT|nr:type II toxin-antitoxin system RelE/ParE family toxin [Sulfurimonas sediminis]QOP43944.1 type II toxin-antitoxin system RelE/ParE family toxin [Sulfurimonas sediminis]